jgi:hypothetical protein
MNQHFTVDHPRPFLFYAARWSNATATPSISLAAMIPISTPGYGPTDVPSLFTERDTSQMINPIVVVNYLCNEVAALTRRGTANLAFVHTKQQADLLQSMWLTKRRDQITFHVEPYVTQDEVWVTYWKRINEAVDGGIQILPDGEILIAPNYQSYFLKGKLPS